MCPSCLTCFDAIILRGHYIEPEKCQIFNIRISYLNHVILQEQLEMLTRTTTLIRGLQNTTVRELWSF